MRRYDDGEQGKKERSDSGGYIDIVEKEQHCAGL